MAAIVNYRDLLLQAAATRYVSPEFGGTIDVSQVSGLGDLAVLDTVGTPQIQAGSITAASAILANAAVETLSIAGDAVTVPSFGQTTADTTLSLSAQLIVSTSFGSSEYPPPAVYINAGVQTIGATGSPATAELVTLSLYRDATLLVSADVTVWGDRVQLVPIQWTDTSVLSPATTYTYSLKALRTGAPTAISPIVGGASIFAIGVKR